MLAVGPEEKNDTLISAVKHGSIEFLAPNPGESTPTPTGVKADHRVALKARGIAGLARAVAAAAGVAGIGQAAAPQGIDEKWFKALVADLTTHRGSIIVLAGEHQPAAVHVLAHAINEALGNVGSTVVFTSTPEAVPSEQLQSLTDLAGEMEAGKVDLLVIISANPVYGAPPDLQFATRMEKVGLRVHLGMFDDETAALCHWHIPATHFLETWSDARALRRHRDDLPTAHCAALRAGAVGTP